MVKRTNQATLQNAKEALNGVRVGIAASVFLGTMFDRLMAREFLANWLIEPQFVS